MAQDDLVPLAIEFRLGHRHSRRIDNLDDWDNAADARAHGEKSHQIGGEVV